jgi:hypothetical protein
MNQNKKAPVALEPNILFTTLRGMISKQYSYEGKIFTVTDVIEYNTSFKIYTTGGNKVLTPTDANTFIASCTQIENEQPEAAPVVLPIHSKVQAVAPAVQEPQVISKQGAMIDSMTDALFEVFQTIRKEPTKENIEMGTALSNTANTVCNMMKLKLQAEKMSRK